MFDDLKSLLTDEEKRLINSHWQEHGVRHPAWAPLNANDRSVDYKRSRGDILVNGAISRISCHPEGASWLQKIKDRIIQTESPEDCAAVIGEIRCYGALLTAGFGVDSIPTLKTPTPDFRFQLGEHSGVVEVATKQEDASQFERAVLLSSGGLPKGAERSSFTLPGGRADFSVMEQHPFGAPDLEKVGDSTQANAISRIAQIKQSERQIAENQIAILWIDFRNLGQWPDILKAHDTSPLIGGRNGTVTAGPFWYAFYGWRGAPIFAEDYPGRQSQVAMQHFGRFSPERKASKYAAAIICLESTTVLFENPTVDVPLPSTVRGSLTRLPDFDIGHSVADWRKGDLQDCVRLSRSKIEAFQEIVFSHDFR